MTQRETPRPRALITGITGMDGRHLADLLHAKGYQVFGLTRGQNNPKALELAATHPFVEQVPGDLQDPTSLQRALESCDPDEVYNLGAVSFVHLSFEQPELTVDITGLGALRLLEAIRLTGRGEKVRFYQASSSEMFGRVRETPQSELTPFHPRSPYGCAKALAHHLVVNYRESYGIHASCGILFNHESELRGREFVTRKITSTVARIKLGLEDELVLGNLEARRDWGYAPEYVDAMWRMLQQDEGGDYVVATGETHSVREFVQAAFREADLEWERYVRTDERYNRPAEVDLLLGDASKAREHLGWEPKVGFEELVERMYRHDLALETTRAAGSI